MNLQEMTDTFKRLESLLANCRARALAGLRAALAMANTQQVVNTTGPIGPLGTVALQTTTFTTSVSGKVKIRAVIQVTGTGGTGVAGDTVTFNLLQGGSPIAGSVQVQQELSANGKFAGATLAMEIVTFAGTGHTYGVQASCNNGHTIVIPTDAASVEVEESL